MDKKEIKDYLKRVDELGGKLTGYDKETYTWLIYGYNQCAKLLNETEQQCKKQKEIIDKAKSLNYEISHIIYEDFLEENIIGSKFLYERIKKQLSILEDKEVSE